MDKQHRRDGNLGMAFRHAAREGISSHPDTAPASSASSQPAPAGWKSKVKSLLRKPARLAWRLARPFLRGPAHRARNFLSQPLRDDMAAMREALRQDIINTQTWAYQEQLRMTATMMQEIVAMREMLSRNLSTVASQYAEQMSSLGSKHHVEMNDLVGRLGRIETYALKSASRAAVPVADGTVLVRTVLGYVLCDGSDKALIAHLMEAGELESGTRRLIERHIGPGSTFVDVGANVGMHTIAAARAMKGSGQVIAFEPFPETARLLAESLWMSGLESLCTLHVAAVSDQAGEQPLYLGKTSGHHSLFPLEPSLRGDVPQATVRLVTLDEAIAPGVRIDLLKIDAEGAELDVIAGGRRVLAENPSIAIIVELGPSHLARTGQSVSSWLSRFAEHGFDYQVIDPDTGELNDRPVAWLETVDSINLFMRRHRAD